MMHAHCGVLRERVLRAADAAFGHRLMRDRVVPGGVTVDLAPEGTAALRALLAEARERAGGLQFIAIQASEEASNLEGFWLLRDLPEG